MADLSTAPLIHATLRLSPAYLSQPGEGLVPQHRDLVLRRSISHGKGRKKGLPRNENGLAVIKIDRVGRTKLFCEIREPSMIEVQMVEVVKALDCLRGDLIQLIFGEHQVTEDVGLA